MSEWADEISIDDVEVVAETDKALLCRIEEDEYWIPKSQISDNSEVYQNGTSGELIVSYWWASKEGFAE